MALKGLGGFKAKQEQKSSQSEDKFFRLKEKGQKAYIRPLVELDETSINYSEKNGVPLFTQEFTNPKKFWLTIEDTREDEGNCVGWDMVEKYGWYISDASKAKEGQHSDSKKNWNPNQFVYIPVLVKDRLDDEPRQEVMRVKFRGAEFKALQEFAEADREVDDEGNSTDPYASVTNRWWTYARNNEEGYGVRYSLQPRDPSDDVNVEDYEVPELDSDEFINKVPYANQKAFLQIDDSDSATSSPSDAPWDDKPKEEQRVQSTVATANW